MALDRRNPPQYLAGVLCSRAGILCCREILPGYLEGHHCHARCDLAHSYEDVPKAHGLEELAIGEGRVLAG